MYSQGKRLLDEEKSRIVSPSVVEDALRAKSVEELSVKAKMIQDILKSVDHVAEARLRQMEEETTLRKAVQNFNSDLKDLVNRFTDLSTRLETLIELKNANGTLEREVLGKLNDIL